MKFTHRIFLLPIIAALVFLLLAGATARNNIESRRLSQELEDQHFADLELSLRLANAGLRVYQAFLNAATGDVESGIAEAEVEADRFRFLVEFEDNPYLDTAALDSLGAQFEDYVAVAVPATRMLAESDFDDLDEDQFTTIIEMNERYESLEQTLSARIERSQENMDVALSNSRDRQRLRQKVATLVSVIGFGVLLALSGAVIASVLRPLQTIMRGTEAIAAGDLYQRIDYESKDILGRLADSFRKMQRSLIRDTNERKRAESALRASEERLALAFEAAQDGLWDYSVPDKEIYLSPRYYEILGYREADARIVPDITELCRPRERASVEAAWRAHVVDGQPLDLELELRRRDGEWRRVHARGRIAEVDAEEKPLRSIGTITVIVTEASERGEELLDELGAPLASLLSSAELVVAAAAGERGRPETTALLDRSRSRVADAFAATRDVAEMRAEPARAVTAADVIRVASSLAGREVVVADPPPPEPVQDPADAALRLRDVLVSHEAAPVRLTVLPARGADEDHRFDSDAESVRIAFSTRG